MIGVLQGDGFARLRFAESAYFASLMDGIVDGAFRHHFTVGMCPELYGENPAVAFADHRYDGFVWYSTFASQAAEEYLRTCATPIVLLHTDAAFFNDRFPTVKCDNGTGMRLAVDHLAELGHSRIGFMFDGRLRNGESAERGELLYVYGQERGIDVSFIDIGVTPPVMDAYFAGHPQETALITHSEHYAIEAMDSARRHGVRIPDDLSIIGFDSTHVCDFQDPPLTAIRQPLEEMGMTAAEILIGMINGRRPDAVETILPCGFDVRKSTGPAPRLERRAA